jgi:hypothetical protein
VDPGAERFYCDIKLQVEDNVAISLEAYLKKDSMNFMTAGLRAMARREAEDRGELANTMQPHQRKRPSQVDATVSAPRRGDAISGVNDGMPDSGGQSRWLQRMPVGAPVAGQDGRYRRVAGVLNRDAIAEDTNEDK